MDDGKLLSTYDDAAPTPDAHLAGLRAVAKAARAAMIANGYRQWAQAAMIADGWRQCAQGQRTTQWCGAAEEMRRERDALRALLAEAMPELLGENWQETRYCTHCRSYDGHTDGCLITRIEREVT